MVESLEATNTAMHVVNNVCESHAIESAIYAGAIVALISVFLTEIAKLWIERRKRREALDLIKESLTKELNININKIGILEKELKNLRKFINEERISEYNYYYDISNILTVAIINTTNLGLIYKIFDNKSVEQLQNLIRFANQRTEDFLNNFVNDSKRKFQDKDIKVATNDGMGLTKIGFDKQAILRDLDIWEKAFGDQLSNLEEIIKKVK